VQSSPCSVVPALDRSEGQQAESNAKMQVVFDPSDSPECLRLVMRLACRAAGRVVCHPAPDAASSAAFAVDLLLALGKRFDAVRTEHAVRRSWQLATTWMLAEQISDLFVLRADRLSARRWQELLELARRCRLRLWLIVHRPDLRPSHHRALAATACQPLTLEQFIARWGTAADPEERLHARPDDQASAPSTTSAAQPFPEVPGDDFPLFRAACRRLLDQLSFQLVDDVYQHSYDAADSWLGTHHAQLLQRSPEELRAAESDPTNLKRWLRGSSRPAPPLAEVCALLQRLTATSSRAAETMVRLRAVQAAFFVHGFLLSMRFGSGARVSPADLRPRLDEAAAERLRELCTPHLPAAMVLALVTEMSPAQLCELNLGDVAADGAAVRVDGHWFTIPSYARGLVRAHLLDRAAVGAGLTAALFVVPSSRRRLILQPHLLW
jgi:hypothetical protein